MNIITNTAIATGTAVIGYQVYAHLLKPIRISDCKIDEDSTGNFYTAFYRKNTLFKTFNAGFIKINKKTGEIVNLDSTAKLNNSVPDCLGSDFLKRRRQQDMIYNAVATLNRDVPVFWTNNFLYGESLIGAGFEYGNPMSTRLSSDEMARMLAKVKDERDSAALRETLQTEKGFVFVL